MMVRSFYTAVVILLTSLYPASAISHTATAASATGPAEAFTSITIPVKIIGRLIVMEAKADDQEGAFILDTGAPTLILNQTYFRKKALPTGNNGVGLAGSAGPSYSIVIDRFEFTGMIFERLDAKVSNLRVIEDHIGQKLLGLIGVSILKDFIVTIDMNESLVHLSKDTSDSSKYHKLRSTAPDLDLPMEFDANAVSLMAAIGGQRLRFILDTGAETNVLSAWLSKNVMDETLILRRVLLKGSTGGQVEAFAGIIQRTEIGGRSFVKMRTLITNLNDLRKAYGYRIDGMLGYDFFARGITTINFIENTISMNFYQKIASDE